MGSNDRWSFECRFPANFADVLLPEPIAAINARFAANLLLSGALPLLDCGWGSKLPDGFAGARLAKSENHEVYERLLLGNLQRAIDFLRYAEAKNAALLTLSSALTIALGNVLLNERLPSRMAWGLGFALLLAIAAGLIAVSAFLPRLHLPSFLGGKSAGPHPKNLLYFGDIAALTIKEFRIAIEERYGGADAVKLKPEYLDDLLVQVSVNSQITSDKMRVFRVGAVVITASAIVAALTVAAWGLCSVAGRLWS